MTLDTISLAHCPPCMAINEGTCHRCGPTTITLREYIGKGFRNCRIKSTLRLCAKCGQVVASYTPSPKEIESSVNEIRAGQGLEPVEWSEA